MDKQTLMEEITIAMKAKDKPRLSILRQVHGEIKQIEVDERREVSQADVDAMIKRVLKQTKETLEGSIKVATNDERTQLLTEQVSILESYVPQQVTGVELEALIDQVITETGAVSKRDMGLVMSALGTHTNGNFDKSAAAKIVGARLA
jgi:uncharacterized protein